MSKLIPKERIERKILLIRGQKVMLDYDLAELYGVKTKVLNQAVKRNLKRFPNDFMFQLTIAEKNEVVTICDHLKGLRYSYHMPLVFTEQGIAMLSSVLKSERAIAVNILIMRAFVKLRHIMASHKELDAKLKELEARMDKNDRKILFLFEKIREIIAPLGQPKRKIGFVS